MICRTVFALIAFSGGAFPVRSFSPYSVSTSRKPFLSGTGKTTSLRVLPVDASTFDSLASSFWTADATAVAADVVKPSYSKASYYTTLGVYIMSFPGLWSQIKRSTKAKVKSKTFESAGELQPDGKSLRQQAGEIMAYMKANNYEVAEAGEVITFKGLVAKSKSQAFFLTFCTLLGLASLALVLQIQFQELELPFIGQPNWFLMCLASPYAGIYYWRSGDREDEFKVKLSTNEEETANEIILQGNDEEIDRMWRALDLVEKGMVRVEGLLG